MLVMNNLPPPTNIKAHLLKSLIQGQTISERDVNFNSIRARISDLIKKHGLNILFNWVKFTNRFGHPGMYREHYIPPEEKEKAIEEYLKIVGYETSTT